MIEAKTFRIFITIYFLFKSERLCANIKLTLHKALIRSVMTYACPALELVADPTKLCRRLVEVVQNHEHEHIGGGQANDRSSH
jgi:hypothetical protein